MVGMKIKLKVVKADGSVEEYLHTKVIGTISNALAYSGQADIYVAEQLADVVTYYLYRGRNSRTVTSSEILSIIKAVLTSTEYGDAAVAISEHHLNRKLKRSRIEVVSIDIQQLADAEMLYGVQQSPHRSRWDKSKIVNDLVTDYDISRQIARTIASMVEEKIFSMGLTSVSAGLLKQLVLSDTAAFLQAQRQLQTV
jgi:transcriptional regulator NrdR family protein